MRVLSKSILLISVFVLNNITGIAFAKTNYYEDALQAFNQKDVNSAFIHIKNALRENEKNLPAKILLAQILIEKKAYALAEQELNDAIVQGADFNLVIELLGRSMLLQGKFEQVLLLDKKTALYQQGKIDFDLIKAQAYRALKKVDQAEFIYNNILSKDKNNVQAMLGLVSINIYLQNFEDAKPLLTKVNLIDPKNSKLWQLKGMVARREGDINNAILFLEKSSQLDSDNIVTLRDTANAYIALKNYDKAEQLINKVLLLSPKDPQAQLMKSSLLKNLDQSKLADQVLVELSNQISAVDENYLLSQPQLLLIDAMSSYSQQKWQQAKTKFKLYLKNNPDGKDINSVVLLADTYSQLNEPESALQLLSTYEDELLENKDYALILAGLYLKNNKTFKADYLLIQLRKRYGDDERLLIFSAQVLTKSGKPDKALQLLENAKVARGNNYLETLTVLSMQLGDFKKSLKYITSLTEKMPDNTKYQLLYSRILLKLGQKNKAKKLVEKLYKNNPQDRAVRFTYALLKSSVGEDQEATKILNDIVTQNPNDSEAWFALAQIEYDLGNTKQTIEILEQQAKTPENKIEALYKLAVITFEHQQYLESLAFTNRLLKNNRLDVKALMLKSKVLIALNKIDDAKHQLDILTGLINDDARLLLALSGLQNRVKNYDAAEYSLQLALKLAPNALPVIIENIKLKLQLNKIKEASTLLSKAEKGRYKNNLFLTILRGDLALIKNHGDKAFDYYISALNQDNENVIALIKLSQISYKKPFINKFTQFLSSMVEKHPDFVFQRHTLADHLLNNKYYEQAKYHYQVLLTKNIPVEKRGIALNNLANINIRDKNYTTAIEQSKQAKLALGPVPAVIDTLGWALVLSGDLNKGLESLRQAYTRSSTSPEIQYHIAYALVKLKRIGEAKEMLTSLLSLPNNFEEYHLAQKLQQTLN